MGKRIKLIIAAVMLMPLLVVGVAAAEGNSSTNSGSNNPTKDQSTSQEPDTTVEGIKKRLEETKTELKTSLSTAEQEHIKGKCKIAQGVVKNVEGRVKEAETNRGNVHKNTVEGLTKLSAKLKAKGVDTTALDAEIAVLTTKVNTFKTDLATYKQSISDLKSVDCTTNPAEFKAALDKSRANREKLAKDIADIRSYVTNTIKPTLKTIRDNLATTEKKEGSQ